MTGDAVRPAVLDELARVLADLPPLGEWVEDAACGSLGAGADVFVADHPDVEELAYAEAVCWRCPVRQECADYAARAPVHGLWGAVWHGTTTERQPVTSSAGSNVVEVVPALALALRLAAERDQDAVYCLHEQQTYWRSR